MLKRVSASDFDKWVQPCMFCGFNAKRCVCLKRGLYGKAS